MDSPETLRRADTAAACARKPWRRLVPRSFRTQVALGFGASAVAVALALSVALGSMLADKGMRDETIALRSVAKNAATALADGLASRTLEIRTIAASPTLWRAGIADDRVAQTIARTQALTAYSAWIGVADPGGVVRVATGNLLVGANVAERPWFQEGRSRVHVGDLHGAKLLGSLLPKARDGEPQRFVDFAAPILQDGHLIGVLGMHGSWDWTRSTIEALLPEDVRERRLDVLVLDRTDHVIYASGDPSRAAPAAIVPDADILSVRAPVRSNDASSNLGWTVVAREPQSVVRASAMASRKHALEIGFLAALLACTLGWFVAERLTRSLRLMAATAQRVRAGAAVERFPRFAGSHEVLQLSVALDAMTRGLVAANVELEARVRDRTVELEAANAELDRQVRVDPLTGLLNRRGMEERFMQMLAMGRRTGAPVSVVMIDIDHFKRINDTFGHAAGDLALKRLAQLVRQRVRESDVVVRFGGEEFVVLLPETGAAAALHLASELVAAVAADGHADLREMTISCGVAQVRTGSDTLETVLQRADEALYRVKDSGRNHASFADTALELAPDLA